MILPYLIIAPSPKGGYGGKGVFTTKNFKKDTIIEISPVLVFDAAEKIQLEATKLYDYIFEWGIDRLEVVIGLGYLSIYNHSYCSNCEYEMDFDTQTMSIKTVRDIQKGEELFINYNGNVNDPQPVWFDVK
jgi:SET domain-containing protein